MRMVIPMDDLDAARWINLTGASGHAYNEHYTDQTDLWAEARRCRGSSAATQVESATDETLVLEPAG